MKTIFFLLSFIPFISIDLNAQSDSINPQNTLESVKRDSLPSVTITMPDSLAFDPIQVKAWGPWFCNPEEFKVSDMLISPIILKSAYTPEGARRDIKSGNPVILFWGGFGGMPDFNSKEDKVFQKKYNVTFYSQGCLRLPGDDQEGYNHVIFDYLAKKYGEGWRYELSEGAVGFDYPEPKTVQGKSTAVVASPLAMQLANPQAIDSQAPNPETETSVWWYILPTSGFALLLSFFVIINRRKKK